MIKAIMAVDDEWGISKNGIMPWPKNSSDLKYFKEKTINNVVVMGRLTWDDPFMPTPLKNRTNIVVTSKSPDLCPGADHYISGDLIKNIKNITLEYKNKQLFIIGGAKIIHQAFDLIDVFLITRIRGIYNCDKKLDKNLILKNMSIYKTSPALDDSCSFQVWWKNSLLKEREKNL